MATKKRWYSLRWRFVILMLVLGLFLVGISGCIPLLPMGDGPAGPAISSKDFENQWPDRKYILVGLGDSITRGYGVPQKHSYFELLIKNDDRQFSEMKGCDLGSVINLIGYENFAVDYTVSQEHIDYQLPQVPQFNDKPHGIVVMTSGGNDLLHNYGRSAPEDGAMYGCTYEQAIDWTENIKQRLIVIVEGVQGKFPGRCDIFLGNIYDPTDGHSDAETGGFPKWADASKILNLTNSKIKEICDTYENVHLIDIHKEFLGHGFHCRDSQSKNYRKDDPTFWYCDIVEDPNRRGYDAIRRLYLQEMIKILGN
jgi:hypothetical protein